jgi:hypothetical protein
MTRYVQHKSGQGETWQVHTEQIATWGIKYKPDWLYLPKIEYVEVPAPEVWRDVTSQCGLIHHLEVMGKRDVCSVRNGYRLRKVCDCDPMPPVAFVVERKETS